ncbi:MAG: glycosyltransferase family 4 protein [Bernardetiaceae bacterium]|jgi:glycosyltransferase involved in cell wall biosynthesis|nr:glycosyltransferase family 4 protein [Bernardetiaceae bacterium]
MTDHKPRVMHLVDTLEPGGTEKMGVNICNWLAARDIDTLLVATRAGGPLQAGLKPEVRFQILGKKSFGDGRAFYRLVTLALSFRPTVIHAHHNSLAWAVLLKTCLPWLRLVWHDHGGNSDFLAQRNRSLMWVAGWWINHVVAVNEKLAQWAVAKMGLPPHRVSYVPNFVDYNEPLSPSESQDDQVKPRQTSPVIICTASLRAVKDHPNLIEACKTLHGQGQDFVVWLVGTDHADAYSAQVKNLIANYGLGQQIQVWGQRTDVAALLRQADIGVLASVTEGLPVALLEYGAAGLPVVCTNVGQCAEVLGHGQYGQVVPPKDPAALAMALASYLTNPAQAQQTGRAFQQRVATHYSAHNFMRRYLSILQTLVA